MDDFRNWVIREGGKDERSPEFHPYESFVYNNRNPDQPQFTDHCFTGEYPTSLIDREKGNISKQFSLLTEKN